MFPVTVKLPVIEMSPVIEPPVFALRELFALVKAALAYSAAELAVALGVFACKKAALAAAKAAVIELFCVVSVAVAALAAAKALLA